MEIVYNPPFLDAIASPSSYPCQSVGGSVSESVSDRFRCDAIASPSFVSLFITLSLILTAGIPGGSNLGCMVYLAVIHLNSIALQNYRKKYFKFQIVRICF